VERTLLLLLAAALSGCAGLTAHSIGEGTAGANETGIRYFDTSPFLLVYTDGKGGLESKVIYLPDTTKLRTIKPYAYGAKNDTTLKFDNGKLVQAKSVVDETIIPVAAIAGLEKVAISLAKANAAAGGIPSPYLFRIVSDDKGNWTLAGGQAMNGSESVKIKFAD
jgi:hypothetical protein